MSKTEETFRAFLHHRVNPAVAVLKILGENEKHLITLGNNLYLEKCSNIFVDPRAFLRKFLQFSS